MPAKNRVRTPPNPAAPKTRQPPGEQTRNDILDAAEELFAEWGHQGVSIRSINGAAGVGMASIHYHFGSKDALVFAVLARRGTGITRRYHQLFDEFAKQRSPSARDLVDLFAQPLVELLAAEPVRGHSWLKFAAHLSQTHDPQLEQATIGPGLINDRFDAAVARVLPGLPREAALLRWRIASSAVMRLLATGGPPGSPLPGSRSDGPGGVSEEYLETLLEFAAAGLAGRAPARRVRRAGRKPPADSSH